MLMISIAIVPATRRGVKMVCADGYTRRCFPILTKMISDYEEQVLLTGVKSGVHCVSCTVKSNERENLLSQHANRTHQSTRAQIDLQGYKKSIREEIPQNTDDWVHDADNFAWDLP